MPRRNLSVVSKEEDPYRLQRYPVAFQVMLSNGKQAHNARELVKAAKFKGQWLDMARQPIPAAKVREILALTGQRPHANTGRLMPASQLAKLRKLAKRELLVRQGKSVVGPMQYRATGRPTAPAAAVPIDGLGARFGAFRARWNDNERAYLRTMLEQVLHTGTVLARGKFRELDAHGVFRGYDEDQRDGAEFGLVHHFTLADWAGWDHRVRGYRPSSRQPTNRMAIPNELRAELVSRLPRIQSLPAHAQEVARRFAAMTPGALDALTRVAPPRRSARIVDMARVLGL